MKFVELSVCDKFYSHWKKSKKSSKMKPEFMNTPT